MLLKEGDLMKMCRKGPQERRVWLVRLHALPCLFACFAMLACYSAERVPHCVLGMQFSDMLMYAQEQSSMATQYVAPKTTPLKDMRVG
jgi:hypothetical protein